MMMSREEIIESGLIEQYALGLTNQHESTMVEDALLMYPDLKQHLNSIEKVLERIAEENKIVPPARIKDSFTKSLGKEELTPSRPSNYLKYLGGIAAFLCLLASITSYNFYQDSKVRQIENQSLISSYTDLEKECGEQKTKLEKSERLINLYESEEFAKIILSSADVKGRITVFWASEKKRAFINQVMLPKLPADQCYQAWADVNNEMISIGTFDASQDLIPVKFLENATSINVTIEPKGGSKHPTIANLILSGGV